MKIRTEDDSLPIWLIRLERGLRTGRLDIAGEAVTNLRRFGIDVRVHHPGPAGQRSAKQHAPVPVGAGHD